MAVAQTSKRETTIRRKPSAKEHVKIVRNAYDAFARRDIAAVLETLDPKIAWHEPSGPLPPPAGGGTYHGRDAVANEIFGAIPKAWDEFAVEPDEFLEAGNRVVVVGAFHVKPKGRQTAVTAPCVQIWTMRNGKAVSMENYTDTQQLARALAK